MLPETAIILVKPKSAGNIGAVARAMKNFGLSELRFVSPEISPTDPKALSRAMFAENILKNAKEYSSLKEAIKGCHLIAGTSGKKRNSPQTRYSPRSFADVLSQHQGKQIGLVFGSEPRGLSNEDLLLCNLLIEIPTSDGFSSMNLSHAVIIILYEIFVTYASSGILPLRPASPKLQRGEQAQGQNDGESFKIGYSSKKIPTAEEKEAMFEHLREALLAVEYLDSQNPDRIMKDIRAILSRAELDEREVSLFRGIAGKIIKKI